MKTVLSLVAGAALGVVHVVLTGILIAQAKAQRGGAVLNLNNEVVRVQEPAPPVLFSILVAALCGLVITALIFVNCIRTASARIALRAGYLAVAVAAIAYGFANMKVPPEGFTPGPSGWVIQGGTTTVLILAAMVAAVTLVSNRTKAAK